MRRDTLIPRFSKGTHRHVLASLLLLVVQVVVQAEARAAEPFLPVLFVAEVRVQEFDRFAQALSTIDAVMRSTHNTSPFYRAYVQHGLETTSASGFLLSPAATFAQAFANLRVFNSEPALADSRSELAKVVEFATTTYLKAVRFDGTNTPGWLNNLLVDATNEDVLLQAVEELTSMLESESGRPMINVFRVVAGSNDFTHLVSINAASETGLAVLLETLASLSPPLSNAGISVVRNALYFELLPTPQSP